MAKASNPMDAHRKSLKAKDKKRNKEARDKAKDAKAVKSGTRGIEADIRRLTDLDATGTSTASDKAELERLNKEWDRVKKLQADAAVQNPQAESSKPRTVFHDDPAKLYRKDGKLKDPKRSIYYDPILNPFGVPPPGMPYQERETTPDDTIPLEQVAAAESESDSLSDDENTVIHFNYASDSLDGIVMPREPHPSMIPSRDLPPLPPADTIPSYPPPHAPRVSAATFSAVENISLHSTSAIDQSTSSGTVGLASLPSKPIPNSTVSGEAQLRDLKKEATTFVPNVLKRKRETRAEDP